MHLVVIGVAGTGKTTVAERLVERLGWPFAEADDFHPPANREKMAAGRPLTDQDRLPWLQALAAWAGERHAAGESTLSTCSALRRSYRDLLRTGAPGTTFAHLAGDKDLLMARMRGREHFFPPELLESQLDTLEPLEPDEDGITVDVAAPVGEVADEIVRYLEQRPRGVGHPDETAGRSAD